MVEDATGIEKAALIFVLALASKPSIVTTKSHPLITFPVLVDPIVELLSSLHYGGDWISGKGATTIL